MGSNFSSDHHRSSKPKLSDLPESCIANILTNLPPLQICKLARLDKSFHRASSADFIWESKLPSNYQFLAQQVLNLRYFNHFTKKDLYGLLSGPNFFDQGKKVLWIDKVTGGPCVSISSRALSITMGDDRRYWTQFTTEESRYKTVAYLQQIWWLELDGELKFKFPKGKYSVFFRLHVGKPLKRLGRRVCNIEHVNGWDIKPVKFQLTVSDEEGEGEGEGEGQGESQVKKCYLQDTGKWVEYHVGDFVVESSCSLVKKVKVSLTQIDCTHTKGGLCVDEVLILPFGVGR